MCQHLYYTPHIIPFLWWHPPYHSFISVVHGTRTHIFINILPFYSTILISQEVTPGYSYTGGTPSYVLIWSHRSDIVNIRENFSLHSPIWPPLINPLEVVGVHCISWWFQLHSFPLQGFSSHVYLYNPVFPVPCNLCDTHLGDKISPLTPHCSLYCPNEFLNIPVGWIFQAHHVSTPTFPNNLLLCLPPFSLYDTILEVGELYTAIWY